MTRQVTITVFNPMTGKEETLHISAWWGASRSGFNHFAKCVERPEITAKIHYINRTWEAEVFDCVIASCTRKVKETIEGKARVERKRTRKTEKSLQLTFNF